MKRPTLAFVTLFHIVLAHSALPALAQYSPAPGVPIAQPSPALQTKVIDIGQRLLSANGIKEPIRFGVAVSQAGPQNPSYMMNSMGLPPGMAMPSGPEMAQAYAMMANMGISMPNMAGMAMAGPGLPTPNQVTLGQDLLSVLTDEDELAAALAHELSHQMRDPLKEMQRGAKKKAVTNAIVGSAFGALSTAASIAGGFAGPAGMIGSQAVGAAHGLARRGSNGPAELKAPDERELDTLTLSYLSKAGYSPTGLERLYQKALDTNTAAPLFFMNHQVGSARIAAVHAEIQKKYPQALASASQTAKPLPAAIPATSAIPTTQPGAALAPNPIQPTAMASTSAWTLPSTPMSSVESKLSTDVKNLSPTQPVPPVATSGSNLLQLLKPEEIRVLGLINEKGYLARVDLNKQFNALEVKALPGVLEELANKKLIRIVGTQPNDGFVLTDTAAQTFGTAQKP